jgi:hypothetical protein
MIRALAIGWCLTVIFASAGIAKTNTTPPQQIAAAPAATQTAPPDVAAPSPAPLGLEFNGQVIDIERGYVVFSSGDALRLARAVSIKDAATNVAPTYKLAPGFYAVATIDQSTGEVSALRTSLKALPGGTAVALVPRRYVIAASSPKPNPDLAPHHATFTSALSKKVTVSVTVQVPPNTPFTDDVYMTTDTSGWNAQAIKMQRVDGLHFSIQMDLAGGTVIHYLFTRGNWTTVERDRAGLQRKPRSLDIEGGDSQIVDATVFRWADLP